MFCFYKETDLFKINYRFLQTTVLLGYFDTCPVFVYFLSSRLMYLLHWNSEQTEADRGFWPSVSIQTQPAVTELSREIHTSQRDIQREVLTQICLPKPHLSNRQACVENLHNSTLLHPNEWLELVALLSESVWWCSTTWRAGELVFTITSMNNVPSYQVVQ